MQQQANISFKFDVLIFMYKTTGVIKRMTLLTVVYSVIDQVLNKYYLKQLDYSLSVFMRDKINCWIEIRFLGRTLLQGFSYV